MTTVEGQFLVTGKAEGPVISTKQLLSFWGGFDPHTGRIIDQHHELRNVSLAGNVFVIPSGKGSSTGSPVLVDAIMLDNAPSAIILNRVDEIITLGAIISEQFYNKTIPILVLNDEYFKKAYEAKKAKIYESGKIELFFDD